MIGIDIEKVERFKEFDEAKLRRIFTENEIKYAFKFENPYTHLAGMWCAKEAFIKATKDKTVPLKTIEILHLENGAPYIKITSKLEKYLTKENCSKIDISISHTNEDAIAIVEIN